MQLIQHYFTKNECFKVGQRLKPVGFMIHSTGANNPYLWRYIDDAKNLGKNKYGNHWDQFRPDGRQVCVHGFIGKDKNENIKIYKTLPDNIVAWHCGGSGNNKYIAYEICEDNLKNKKYFDEAMNTAMDVAAFYCKKYGWSSDCVLSHKEGHDRGEATNHGDINYWLQKYDKNMKWFRDGVAKRLGVKDAPKPTIFYQGFKSGAKKWGNIVKNYNKAKYVGQKGTNLTAFGIKTVSDGENSPYIQYRVRTLNGDYYNWQKDRNIDEYGDNFAGDKKKPFDRIQMSLKNCSGWNVKYRVYVKNKGWLGWVTEFNNTNSNGYAGWDGYPIQCIQVQIVKD